MRQGSNTGRRPRGRTNRKQHGGGPSRPNTFDSNGPDGRVRGNARQVYEKYLSLARDAQSAGDRVAAEAYFQHAEHYFRIFSDSTDPQRPDRRQDERQPTPANEGGADSEEFAAGGQVNGEAGASAPQPRPDRESAAGETSDEKGNGQASEAAEQEGPARKGSAQDGEGRPAAAKRRGRPRKPRVSAQEAGGEKEGSSGEPGASEPSSTETAPTET